MVTLSRSLEAKTSPVSTNLLTLIQSLSWLKVVTSHKMTCAARENTSLLEGRRGGEEDISFNTMLTPEPSVARSPPRSYLRPGGGVISMRLP